LVPALISSSGRAARNKYTTACTTTLDTSMGRGEKIMFSNDTKSTAIKAGRPAPFQSGRDATTQRGFLASRGFPVDPRASSQAADLPAPADRLGTALTFLLSLALLAGGSLVVAQIWAHQAMIR
jgi:hypothetical protein